jgi:hypothetical protein
MADVKKVTAVVTKDSIYANQNTDSPVGGEYINFSPSSAVTIDPFVAFIQEESKFRVRIPYSRFYKIKYIISPYAANVGGDDSNIFSWRSYVAFTEALQLMCVSSITGVESEILTGVYKQDGVCLMSLYPISLSTQDRTYSYISGIVEGIVQLNAGDILQFKHSLTLGRKTFITGFNALLSDTSPPIGEYQIDVLSPAGTVNNPRFSASSGFYFEISEITDL